MSAPHACSYCGAPFWKRSKLNAHEEAHDRAERPDFEAQGAAARLAGVSVDDSPYPERTWPEIEWRRGWLRQHLTRKAA
jgi:hypothetical protein